MEKNEVFENDCKENAETVETGEQIKAKAKSIAYGVGFLISALLYFIDAVFIDTGLIGTTAFIIYCSLLFTEGLVRGILEKKKKATVLFIVGEVMLAIYLIGFILGQFF